MVLLNTVFPRLDALHVLDASAHFDAGWSGRNTFWKPSYSTLKLTPLLLLTPGTQHTICWLTPRRSNRGNTVQCNSFPEYSKKLEMQVLLFGVSFSFPILSTVY